jgi:hypothetical protein
MNRSVDTERLGGARRSGMNWYTMEQMAAGREREIEKAAEMRRLTTGERKPVHFWLIAVLRAWIIRAA